MKAPLDTGQKARMEILHRDAERKIMEPLRTHKWTVAVEREFSDGMIISAERGGHQHKVALIYSSATDNAVYKSLATQVERIFFNGQPYLVEQFTHGVDKPVSSADDFYSVLLEWNKTSTEGKFLPGNDDEPVVEPTAATYRFFLSETPIEAIWLRIRQLQSVTLARKTIERRWREEGVGLEPSVIQSKAEGLAYALRNAADYFQTNEGRNVSQRVLNLYYGSTMAVLRLPLPKCLPRRLAPQRSVTSRTVRSSGTASIP